MVCSEVIVTMGADTEDTRKLIDTGGATIGDSVEDEEDNSLVEETRFFFSGNGESWNRTCFGLASVVMSGVAEYEAGGDVCLSEMQTSPTINCEHDRL